MKNEERRVKNERASVGDALASSATLKGDKHFVVGADFRDAPLARDIPSLAHVALHGSAPPIGRTSEMCSYYRLTLTFPSAVDLQFPSAVDR